MQCMCVNVYWATWTTFRNYTLNRLHMHWYVHASIEWNTKACAASTKVDRRWGVSCPLAGAVELFHQTRAASETLSALLGGDSVKRLSFVRFMTMETTSTLFILTHTVGD